VRKIAFALLVGGSFGATTAALAQTQGAGAAPPQSANGADSGSGIADIVVTAQRRAESVQNVPIAISAFTAADLDARGVTSTLGLVTSIPNLVGHNNTGLGAANTYYLRGIGTTESLATQDPPVGTYVDDIYISRQSANNFALFNVDRIEVLRGPQGTLFGRNTTGGAINVILAKPRDHLGGFAEASYGSYDRVTARAAIDLPASPHLLFNLSGFYIDDNGYVKDTTTGERLNDQHSYGVRLAARATPLTGVTWDVAGMYIDDRSSNILNFDCDPANPAQCDGRFATTGLRKANNGANQLAPLNVANGKGNLPFGARTKFGLVSSNLQIDVAPKTTLNLISGYVNTRQDYLIDFFDGRAAPKVNYTTDPVTGRPTSFNLTNNIVAFPPVAGLPQGGFDIANLASSEQFTQEVKLNGTIGHGLVDYVAGAFYYREVNRTDFADVLTSAVTRAPLLLADRMVINKTRAIAGYAQFDLNATDQIKLTAGVRYTDETKTFSFFDNRPICQATPLPATCLADPNFTNVVITPTLTTTIPLAQTTRIWTPRFAINYKPTRDILLFASATKGFKSGSQSARATAIRNLLPFGPEKVWSYEAGVKSDLFDRRLRLNLTGFVLRVSDFQGGSAFINPATGALTFVTRNLGQLRNEGIEAEIVAVPVRGLTLSVNAGLQDARYGINLNDPAVDRFNLLSVGAQLAECQAALGGTASPRGDARTALARAQSACGNGLVTPTGALAKPARTPHLSLSANFAYKLDLGRDYSVTPAVNVVHYSSQEVGTANLTVWRNPAGVLDLARDGAAVEGSFQRGYELLNASLTFATPDAQWVASIACDNCTDRAVFQSTLSNYSYLNPPRSFTVRVRRKF